MKPKQPADPAMTLGNMRELGVARLIASCLNDACRHTALVDVSLSGGYRGAVVSLARRVREVLQPRQQDRRSPELERAAATREPNRQAVALAAEA
jgi:hypothetical protein